MGIDIRKKEKIEKMMKFAEKIQEKVEVALRKV